MVFFNEVVIIHLMEPFKIFGFTIWSGMSRNDAKKRIDDKDYCSFDPYITTYKMYGWEGKYTAECLRDLASLSCDGYVYLSSRD